MNKIHYLFLISLLIASCSYQRELRGKVYKSKNKSTYLVILDDCNQNKIYVDGKLWTIKTNELGEISPGLHKITGCGEVTIQIIEGTIFKFDYWGP
jgi:hypothetical protein